MFVFERDREAEQFDRPTEESVGNAEVHRIYIYIIYYILYIIYIPVGTALRTVFRTAKRSQAHSIPVAIVA